MLYISDSEKVYKADVVLMAMGFLGPERGVIDELALDQDPRSNIETTAGKYTTSVEGVYTAGGKHNLITTKYITQCCCCRC